MFIVGYPLKDKQSLITAKEKFKRYRSFIRKAGIHSIQVVYTVPIVGTDLRKRLKGRIFPPDLAPWTMYDGAHICFKPDDMTIKELQWIAIKLMKGFYQKLSLLRIAYRTIIFPVDFFIRGWGRWHQGWKKDVINYSGHLLFNKWLKRQRNKEFIKKLEQQGL